MATTEPTLASSVFEGRRPSTIPGPPSTGEIKKLREKLQKYDGGSLTHAACEFLATSVASPPGVRTQLGRPTIRPTATGYLEVIRATVPIDVLTPDPTNGRVVGATAWPASDQEDGQTLKLWAPADMTIHAGSNCEVLLSSDSLTTIKTVIEEAAQNTKALNPKMKDKVERDGILDPLLCQIMHVETLEGHSGISLITRDGSTRCSYAKEAHRSDTHDALFGAVRDLDYRRKRWSEIRRLADGPIDAVTPEQLIEMRTFLVDVEIVIGFHTDDTNITALDAVDDIVRRTHVEVTEPWLPVAQDNSEADQALAALCRASAIGQDEFLLYGGKLPRSQRQRRELPIEADDVVANLMLALGATENRRSRIEQLHGALRAIDSRGQVRNGWKAAIAGALGLRQFNVPSSLLQSAHLALGEALSLEALWREPWENTDRAPETLRDAALAELDEIGEPGPSCRELVVKASGHLAAQGWIKRESRDPQGEFRDQRPPETILDLMQRDPQGIHVLAEAIVAGRRGTDAHAVRSDGVALERVAGDPMPLSNQWVRQTFSDSNDRESLTTSLQSSTSATTPREKVAVHIRNIERLTTEIERVVSEASRVMDENGAPFLETHGWSVGEAENISSRMHRNATQMNRFGVINSINPALPPSGQMDLAGDGNGR